MISIFLWFGTQLAKEYEYEFKIPVTYTNLPQQYYKGFLPNDTIYVQTKMSGYQIIKNNLKTLYFTLDVQNNAIIKSKQWQPLDYKAQIKNLLGNDIKLINIAPQTIKFNIKKVKHKEVPVIPDVNLSFKPGFVPKSKAVISPAKIWVYGNQDVLDTLQYVNTQHYDFKNVKNDVSKKLKIKKIEGLKYNVNEVFYKIPVSEIVEDNIKLPVVIIGKPTNVNLLLFPDKIKIKYKFFKNDFKKIDTGDFRLTVNYDLSKKYWNIHLRKKPSKVFDIQPVPDKITYFIKQNND